MLKSLIYSAFSAGQMPVVVPGNFVFTAEEQRTLQRLNDDFVFFILVTKEGMSCGFEICKTLTD